MHRIAIMFIAFVFLIGCETKLNNPPTNTTGGDTGGDTDGDTGGDISSLNVYYNSDAAIQGFQFDIDGVEVIGASGGAAGAAGFAIQTSATSVIGYTFSTPIPSGQDVLIVLDIEGNLADACLIDNVNFVFSDPNAQRLEARISDSDCTTINIP